MSVLLDTHLILWAAVGIERLPPGAREIMADERTELIFSAASLWEIAIKAGLGRDDFRVDPTVLRRRLTENGYRELPVTSLHAVATTSLPPIHKDPFDRLIVAQAISEGLVLLTADAAVARYGRPVHLV